jgi:hypothetical protein
MMLAEAEKVVINSLIGSQTDCTSCKQALVRTLIVQLHGEKNVISIRVEVDG